MTEKKMKNGGEMVVEVLARHGVRRVFTLCGGHISPILVAAEDAGLQVIDVRHEATAVFAADATGRLSGVPGVAVVTAGPGVTNTTTAVRNAKMAGSPVVLIGGAAPTMLKGRGALQDIDQAAVMRPHVKWTGSALRVRDIIPVLERAFQIAREGVPGPVFVEFPVDMLYPAKLVRQWYSQAAPRGSSFVSRTTRWYMHRHLEFLFSGADSVLSREPLPVDTPWFREWEIEKAVGLINKSERPVMVVGSQALVQADRAQGLQQALVTLGIPVYLSGAARGLLGLHSLHLRHKRTMALKEADLVILAGAVQDFRLGYGRTIPRRTPVIGINRSRSELLMNRKPDLAVRADPGSFLCSLAMCINRGEGGRLESGRWKEWLGTLQVRDRERDEEIKLAAQKPTKNINALHLCSCIDGMLEDDAVIVGDGGDFVSTASYIVRPRKPLCWLDPGPFGTLGAGAGFALGAKLHRPESDVWLLYGDGSAGFSLSEFHTFQKHGVPVIAVVGNDGEWAQIGREQKALFGRDTATQIGRVNYHLAVEGLGGHGIEAMGSEDVSDCLLEGLRIARNGSPVLVNAFIDQTDFRKGSVSM